MWYADYFFYWNFAMPFLGHTQLMTPTKHRLYCCRKGKEVAPHIMLISLSFTRLASSDQSLPAFLA
jgi:hypothetical protein